MVSSTVGFTGTTQIGILGTPVIDPATNAMYVVSETSEQNATSFPHRLHAIDLATGAEKLGGPVLVNDPQMAPIHKLQRTGLTLANGYVYVCINTGLLSSTPASQGTLAYGYPGAEPVVSSNGASNGIVWTIEAKTNALIASDASNLANTLFIGTLSGPAVRWTVPHSGERHVYVGEQGKVFGFQLK